MSDSRKQNYILIGPPGSGKSTMLKIIAGMDSSDEGNVWIHKDIKVVFLQQESLFEEEKTIREKKSCPY